jgi:translocation and assembly module TamB
MVLSFVAIWEALQSRWVARQVSNLAQSYVEQIFNAEIEFNHLQFNLFPPGAVVKDVVFKVDDNIFKLDAKINSVGIFFNPFDVFHTNFLVDEVVVEDGKFVYRTKVKTKNKQQKRETKNFLDNFSLLKEIPLNKIKMNDVLLDFDHSGALVSTAQIRNMKSFISVNTKVRNINAPGKQKYLSKIDEVSLEANVDRKLISIKKTNVKSGLASVNASGSIENYISKNIKYNLQSEVKLPLNFIHEWVDFRHIGLLEKGVTSLSLKLKGVGKKFNIASSIEVNDFITDFVYGESLSAQVLMNSEKIEFSKLKLIAGEQKLDLVKPFEFYHFKKKKFVEDPIIVKAQNLKTNNFLRYLKNSLSILQGNFSGKVRFDLYSKSFRFQLLNKAKVNHLKLRISDNFSIFDINDVYLKKGNFFINEKSQFLMDLEAEKNDMNLLMTAKIGGDEFKLEMPTSYVNLASFNHVAGMKMQGKGILSFRMFEKNKDLVLKLDSDINDYKLEGYKLDKVKVSSFFYLNKSLIHLNKLSASSAKTVLNAKGKINYETLEVQGQYNIEDMNYRELKKILSPILEKNSLGGNDISGNWNLTGNIAGKAKIKDLIVKGELVTKNNYIFNESIDSIVSDIKLENGVVSSTNLVGRKGPGEVLGRFAYSINDNILNFETKIKNLNIHDFNYYNKLPLSLRSKVGGQIKGTFSDSDLSIESDLKLTESTVFSNLYKDSRLSFKYNKERIYFFVDLFNEKITSEGQYLLNSSQKQSFLNLDIKFDDVKRILALLSGVDVNNSGIQGSLRYRLNTTFDSKARRVLSINSNLYELMLKKDPIDVSYRDDNPEILVQNGDIKRWSTDIRGRNFYFISQGKGKTLKDYETTTHMKIDASIIETLNNIVSKASGSLRGKLILGEKSGKEIYEANLTSNNLSLSSTYLPTSLSDTEMRITYKDGIISVEKMDAKLTSGSVALSGDISLASVIPDINLKYKFTNAGLVILKKSNLTFSGEGRVIGKNFPYTLGGDFYIQKLNIVNEITDFTGGKNKISATDIDFLPGKEATLSNQLFNFNVNMVTREPIYIRNSLADVGFTGNIQLLGGEKDPRITGKLTLAPRENKVTFKNNEFKLRKGDVNFTEVNKPMNPELDFNASTKISEYRVFVSVYGFLENFNLKLSSEPSLAQSDILSLIAFGYTEDLSNELSDAQKESMTRAGVGSIIFDSFKINETLKNEFGLQVNLGTEVSQDEGSYLSGRTSEGGGNVGKVRSATTFEIKKKINDDTSLSLSSTVGASSTQKQSINLNYNLKNNVSVEGVYESKSTDQAETINDDTSFGADFKWRWSFK